MSQPAANAPFQVIEYWLRNKMLRNNEFSRHSLHNVLLRVKDREDEVRNLMAAINGKDASSLCASAKTKDAQKRISVTILGKPHRMFAGELIYKIFRNAAATKKKLRQSCEAFEEDDVCLNPYHYQLVDDNGDNVPDDMSDADRHAMDMMNYFPVVDVNELPDRADVGEEEIVDEVEHEVEQEKEVDEASFFSGAAMALSSTVADSKNSCDGCKELRKELKESRKELKESRNKLKGLRITLRGKDATIAELQKQLMQSDNVQQPPEETPATITKRKQ